MEGDEEAGLVEAMVGTESSDEVDCPKGERAKTERKRAEPPTPPSLTDLGMSATVGGVLACKIGASQVQGRLRHIYQWHDGSDDLKPEWPIWNGELV
jgi:hypothetical protein